MAKKEIIQAYQHVFSGPMGEEVLKDLNNLCGMNRSSFDGPYRMAFKEGMRNVGLHIQAMLESEAVDKPAKVKTTDPI